MAEFQESSIKFPSISSEIRDSAECSNLEPEDGDENFYEEIEAPKFVDFTAPHHYCPDDRYWFCLRVGCDQKHEEEMDSEAIYKNFVLRVMAARSPNIRLRKALDRNASRSPSKCPLSAPSKPSRPRLSNLAIISSFSKKMGDGKKGVVRSLLKPKPFTTPMLKTKPVAAKYLTTPRNRACGPNQCSFRSVQNPKTTKTEEQKSAAGVAKVLVFRSPRKKTVKVKTSVELRTPMSKLCKGMSNLEILSQRKRTLGYLSKSSKNLGNTPLKRQLSGHKVQGKSQGPSVSSQMPTNQESNSGRHIKSKVKGKLEQHALQKKLLGNDSVNSSKKSKVHGLKKEVSEKIAKVDELKEAAQEEPCLSSDKVATSTVMNSDLALLSAMEGQGNYEDLKCNEKSRSQAQEGQEMNSNDRSGEGGSERSGELLNHLNSLEDQKHEHEVMGDDDKENAVCSNNKEHVNNSSKEQKQEDEFMDGDGKENAAAFNENRMHKKDTKLNGRKLVKVLDKYGQVKKEVSQAENKSLKEGSISHVPAMMLKRPKTTNPKPFRLRTDERGILKEANLERKTDPPTPGSENANPCTPNGKLPRKQGCGIQKKHMTIELKGTPKGLQRPKAAISATLESSKHQDLKPMRSPLERLEKFRKMNSPTQKHTVKFSSPAKKETTSFLIHGQKLEVIHEVSPEVWKAGKPSGGNTHVLPRSCIKNLNR